MIGVHYDTTFTPTPHRSLPTLRFAVSLPYWGWRWPDFDAVGITWDEFGQRVCRRRGIAHPGQPPAEDELVERAAINQYCIVLHDALKTDDTLVMTQAYREDLGGLRPIAERKIGPELADDLTQQALFNIWHAFRSKPQPLTIPVPFYSGAFASWSVKSAAVPLMCQPCRKYRQSHH